MQNRRRIHIVFSAALLLLLALTLPAHVRGQEEPFRVFLPILQRTESSPPSDLEWDPRLDARGAVLVEAAVLPGEGYYRLVRARWYNSEESEGRHHIFMDVLDGDGVRQTGVDLLVEWPEGATVVQSQAKPNEEYAADFAMFALAPAYMASPDNGAPADRVEGMGLGEIDDPFRAHHTSYGLVWQWTIGATTPEATGQPTPTVSATPPITTTVTPSRTPTISPTSTSTVTPPVTATLTPTGTIEMTPTATGTLTGTPTSTATPTPTADLLFSRAVLTECRPADDATRIEGTVYFNEEPADGYKLVFSFEPDGTPVTAPTDSGPLPPGTYTHIISSGIAYVGDWWIWIIDDVGTRISPLGFVHTDGKGGECNVATIDFYGP